MIFLDIPTKNGFSFAGSCCGFGGLSCGFASCAFVRVYTDVLILIVFLPWRALGPSVAPSVAPPCTLPCVSQLPLFAQALVPQLATVPAVQGNQTFQVRHLCLFFLAVPDLRCRGSCPGGAFPRSCCRGPWLLVVYFCVTL